MSKYIINEAQDHIIQTADHIAYARTVVNEAVAFNKKVWGYTSSLHIIRTSDAGVLEVYVEGWDGAVSKMICDKKPTKWSAALVNEHKTSRL